MAVTKPDDYCERCGYETQALTYEYVGRHAEQRWLCRVCKQLPDTGGGELTLGIVIRMMIYLTHIILNRLDERFDRFEKTDYEE